MQEDDAPIRSTAIWWEKWRLLYNGIMLVCGVLIAVKVYQAFQAAPQRYLPHHKSFYSVSFFVQWCILFGVVANAFYCLGPLGEIYARLILHRQVPGWQRKAAFVLGLLFSFGVLGYVGLVALLSVDPQFHL